MTLSPIVRVLSTLRRRRVRALLMGGQACVLYGAAEFSRDIDIAVAVDPANLARLRSALHDLRAELIFHPPLDADALLRGHACHFRCRATRPIPVRLDVMSVMRGAAPFSELWKRRREFVLPSTGRVAVMAIEDLVQAKKTQRDKDWPMIRRLVDADIASAVRPSRRQVAFWLRECRTAETIVELVRRHPEAAKRAARAALRGGVREIERALRREEDRERELDRRYWAPLKEELRRWRESRRGL